MSDRPLPSRHADLIRRALAHVEAHLDQPLTADSLADRAAMSRHHFHRVFAAQLGCSVGRYVTARRLQRACALLVSGREPVLEIALAVGFESSQSLAKAMRRDLGCSPNDVRRGHSVAWTSLLHAGTSVTSFQELPTMQPTRFVNLPEQPALHALTATARGMVGRSLHRAAQQAFGELMAAVDGAGQMSAVRSCIALAPDDPKSDDDPDCRYIAGVVFGHDLATRQGEGLRPDIALHGSLAWVTIAPGRWAVFTHIGPYETLHRAWDAIYGGWLSASGETLRDTAPMELCITTPDRVPPEKLHTEIWIPLA